MLAISYCRLIYSREQLCNGNSQLCDRKYGNVTFVGAHDSFASSSNFFARKNQKKLQLLSLWDDILTIGLYTVSRTQEVDVTAQLRLGVRLLQAQAHMCVLIFMFLFLSVSCIYIFFLGMERILTSATLVSLQNCVRIISANLLYFPSLL